MPLPTLTFAHDATIDTVESLLGRLKDLTVVLVTSPTFNHASREVEGEVLGIGEYNGHQIVNVNEDGQMRLIRLDSIEQIIIL